MSYRPTEKTKARKKSQHSRLLTSALDIVSKSGFQGLTVSAVAIRSEVAIGTVYKYFDSKAALCVEVFKRGTEKEVTQVQLAAFPEGEPGGPITCRQRLLNAISIFSQRAIEGHRLAYALIAEPVDPIIETERLKYRRAYAEIFETLLSEGIEAGEFCQQETRISASALVGTLAETVVLDPLALDPMALGPIDKSIPGALGFNQQQLIENIQNFCIRAVTK